MMPFEWLDFSSTMGAASVVLALVGYAVYLWETLRGTARPHPLTWGLFGLVTLTAFFVQANEGGGAGSWALMVTWPSCVALALLGLWKGERSFPRGEWYLFFAGIGVFLTYLCSQDLAMVVHFTRASLSSVSPTIANTVSAKLDWLLGQHGAATSVTLATAVDLIGYGPTFGKIFRRGPLSDSWGNYFFNGLKFGPAIAALDVRNYSTCVFPAAIMIMNFTVACTILLLKRKGWPQPVARRGR